MARKKNRQCRQFHCGQCNALFWRSVPASNPIAACRNHRQDDIDGVFLRALSLHSELGTGFFKCGCGRNWKSGRANRFVEQECFDCLDCVLPERVGPARRKEKAKQEENHECSNCPSQSCTVERTPFSAVVLVHRGRRRVSSSKMAPFARRQAGQLGTKRRRSAVVAAKWTTVMLLQEILTS